MKGIDFLESFEKKEPKKEIAPLIKAATVVFLIFYCLFMGLIFFCLVYFQKEEKTIAFQINEKMKKIESLKKVEFLQTTLKQRLSALDKIFSQKRPKYQQILSYLNQAKTEGVSLTKIEISQDGEIKLSGSALTSYFLSEFFENLTSSESFSEITLSSLNRLKDGGYNFSLILKSYEKS